VLQRNLAGLDVGVAGRPVLQPVALERDALEGVERGQVLLPEHDRVVAALGAQPLLLVEVRVVDRRVLDAELVRVVQRLAVEELLPQPVLAVRRGRRDDQPELVGQRRVDDQPGVDDVDERGLVDPEDVEAGASQRLRVVGGLELDDGARTR
jgi:hypothetical protein